MELFPGGHLSRRQFLAGTGAAAAGLSLIPSSTWSYEAAKLNFYNWDTYIGETTLKDFTEVSGINAVSYTHLTLPTKA